MNRGRRVALGLVLSVVAANAAGGAWYGLTGAQGVPREWLEGSPFHDYMIPSVLLGLAVGGSALLGAIAVFAKWLSARTLALGAAAVLFGWIVVQLALIGYVSWLQPVMATTAVVIAALAAGLTDTQRPASA